MGTPGVLDFKVNMANGAEFEVQVDAGATVAEIRKTVEAKHGVPPLTFLKLMQNAQALLDSLPVANLQPAEPIFAVISRDTNISVLLQAAGTWEGYQELLLGARPEGEAASEDLKVLVAGPMPSILTVLEDMGGQPPQIGELRPADSNPELLHFSGDEGHLLLPSLAACRLMDNLKVSAIPRVTICIGVNSDAFNRGLGIGLEPSALMDKSLLDDGLPWYTYCDLGVSRKKHIAILKFHPNMHGGQLRLEGYGGWNNTSLGFTPLGWTVSGNKLHQLEFTLGADGRNEFVIRGTEDGQVWSHTWTDQLFDGKFFPSVFAWIDLGGEVGKGLFVGLVSLKVHLP